jgi:hypothetical protein
MKLKSLSYYIGYYYTFINPMGSKKKCLTYCRKYRKITDTKKFAKAWRKEINEL